MTNAPVTIHPDAQPDVPRSDVRRTPPAPTGPVDSVLGKAVNDLRNAVSAIGPVNFLPDTAPDEDLRTLRRATEIVLRLVDANNKAV